MKREELRVKPISNLSYWRQYDEAICNAQLRRIQQLANGIECPRCGGKGMEPETGRGSDGFIRCERCNGTGKIGGKPIMFVPEGWSLSRLLCNLSFYEADSPPREGEEYSHLGSYILRWGEETTPSIAFKRWDKQKLLNSINEQIEVVR